ncbi:MAG: aminoacyl-tRNA hydrolase [Calditrichia bacterium]|nr:aminoacyl-tRNA hydrolase [Calditrichia bacterium]
MIKAIIFLGNPGKKYEETRHNIGWKAVSNLSFSYQLDWQKKFKGIYAQFLINGRKYLFLQPQNFMNLSGESVQPFMQFFKFEPEEIIVVHDDLELDFGIIDCKKGGGLGGHNGLRSISQQIGTKDFYRLRIGISRPTRGDVTSHVLGKFTPDEQISLPIILEKSANALEFCLENGIDSAVNKFSKVKVIQ